MSGETTCAYAESRRKASFRMLSVRVEPELLRELHGRAERLKMNVSDLVRSYILTGLFLHDVDSFLRSRTEDDIVQGGSSRAQARTGRESAERTKDDSCIEELFSAAKSEHTAKDNQVERTAKTLEVRIDAPLLKEIKRRIHAAPTDVSSYVSWCIQSGLFLENLDKFIRSKSREGETVG